jgi:hypothetical protein
MAKHKGSITRIADAAIATLNLLVKVGSDASHIAVMAAVTDVPIGVCMDTPAAGDEIAIGLFGCADETRELVAGEAIGAGVRVYAGATGKVTLLPAAAGTYFCVGTAITAAGDDGDLIEVDTCVPYPVTVTE